MGDVIRLSVLDLPCRAAYSADSAALEIRPLASVLQLRLPHSTTPGESGHVDSICKRSGTQSRVPVPALQGSAKSKKRLRSLLCRESLASHDSIMDDKSMQGWTNLQLTAPEARRTIAVVGRPTKPTSPATYRAQFFERVRTARKLYTDHPPTMAHALGVDKGTYYRYETRLMLPHHLIPLFCEITGVPMDWLMKGPDASRATAPLRKVAGSDQA